MGMKNNAGGCSCCGPPPPDLCCATLADMCFDLSMPSVLPDMADVPIDYKLDGEDCVFNTTGPYNCEVLPDPPEPSQGPGYVHPCEKLSSHPNWAVNANYEVEYTRDVYDATGLIQNLDTNECHLFVGTTAIIVHTKFGGSFELVTGNEPEKIPYFVNVQYSLEQPWGEFGGCFLIVKAKFDYETETAQSLQLNYDQCHSGETPVGGGVGWPVTETAEQYSPSHPCWEDAGSPGSTWAAPYGPIAADHLTGQSNGYRRVARPFAWEARGMPSWGDQGGNYVAPYDGTEPEFTLPDDPEYVFKDYTFTGFGQSEYEWRINLTSSGITDLADLPATVLNYGNLYGLTNNGTFYLKANIPFWLQNPTWNQYVPDSLAVASQYMGDSFFGDCPNPTDIVSTNGQHACNTTWPNNPCGVGQVQGSYGELLSDIIGGKAEFSLSSQIETLALHDFDLTIKPCP